MTNHWVDIKNADVVLIMGGNAAEALRVQMGHGSQSPQQGETHRRGPALHAFGVRGGLYAPIRTGTDIIFLGGVIKYLLDHDKIQHEYVRNYTDFSFIVREDFAFDAPVLGLQRRETQL